MLNVFDKIVFFESLDSTSDYLIHLHKKMNFKKNLVVCTTKQKQGRGRIGKKWISNNHSLTFSFSIKLNSEFHEWTLNMIISLVLVNTFRKYGVDVKVKYPNDILAENSKIAGILIDCVFVDREKYYIVGVGANINNLVFPKTIKNAISIKNILLKNISKYDFLKFILCELDCFINNPKLISRQYMIYLHGAANFIPAIYQNSKNYVKILNVTNLGLLTIQIKNGGIYTVNDKEIKFILQ
tara:strand:- start:1621 stop:2340 length:720 start_codon:yes stop_codon:yes gene_type:complete